MKRKGVFIAAGIGLILLVVGILIYISIKNPEALTKAPIDQPIEGEVNNLPAGEIPPISSPTTGGLLLQNNQDLAEPIGKCLIIADENCSKAFVLHSTDGTRTYGVGFSGISGEIKLYAPIDGYVSYINNKEDGSGLGSLFISATAPWKPAGTMEQLNDPNRDKSLVFSGYGMEPSINGKIKKGDQIGVIKPGQVVYADNFKEKATLLFTPEAKWDQGITRSEDPVEYVKQIVQLIQK